MTNPFATVTIDIRNLRDLAHAHEQQPDQHLLVYVEQPATGFDGTGAGYREVQGQPEWQPAGVYNILSKQAWELYERWQGGEPWSLTGDEEDAKRLTLVDNILAEERKRYQQR